MQAVGFARLETSRKPESSFLADLPIKVVQDKADPNSKKPTVIVSDDKKKCTINYVKNNKKVSKTCARGELYILEWNGKFHAFNADSENRSTQAKQYKQERIVIPGAPYRFQPKFTHGPQK